VNEAHFTHPTKIGTAFGPGKSVVSCLTCGAVILEPDLVDALRDGPEIQDPSC
jgi:hypothetical protein